MNTKKPESIKDTIADKFRNAGYDFMTAYEMASNAIREFKESGRTEMKFAVMVKGRAVDSFEIRRKP